MLVGVLAAFVAPRIDIQGFERQAFASELINALRYAQKTAIGSGCHVRATVNDAADSYSLAYTGDGGVAPAAEAARPLRIRPAAAPSPVAAKSIQGAMSSSTPWAARTPA